MDKILTYSKSKESYFDYYFENESTSRYLVIDMPCDKRIIDYQIEMIRKNSVKGIVPLNPMQKNNSYSMYYNISSKISLSEIFKRKELTKDEFINIMSNITSVILKSKEFLLYENSFILSMDLIFIEDESLDVSMVYVPARLEKDISYTFKEYLTNMVTMLAQINGVSNRKYLNEISDYLKKHKFSILKFHSFIESMRSSKNNEEYYLESWVSQEEAIQSQFQSLFENEELNRLNQKETQTDTQRNKETPLQRGKKIGLVKSSFEDTFDNKHSFFELSKFKIMVAILSQVIIVIMLLLSQNIINSVSDDQIVPYVGVGIIVAAVDIILFKNLFAKH